MTVYGDVSSNSTGIVNYYFKVYRYISDSSSVLIATSTASNDVNALNGIIGSPTAYYMQATVTETSMNLTDRILINLDISSNGAPINTSITTYFENDYYSYVQTSLNDGTNILSSYNTWTGNNDFQAVGLKTVSIDSNATALTIGGTTSSSLVLGKASNTTNIQGNLQIAGLSGSNGQVLKSNGTTTVWGDNWTGTATSNLNMSSFSIDASANNLSIGTLTSTGLTLGKSGNTTNIQGNLQIAGAAGTSGQYLTSAGSGSVPTWTTSTGGWVGTATSNLNMSSYNITSSSALSIGNTSVATRLIGNVDISNNLTYANGTLQTYGGTSVGTTAVSINIGTAYPNPNTDFTLILTGTTASRVLTMATARAGYKITIYNKSTQTWTLNCAGSDLFYGNFVVFGTGLATFRNGIPAGKSFTFLQQALEYNLINESCSTTATYFGPLWANNNGNAPINLMGNQEQLFPSTTPYTMPTFTNSMISSFVLCTGTASVINLQSYPLLSQLTTGYVIIIRNNTALPITIQGLSPNPTSIYVTGSTTAVATFAIPTTMTITMKVISGYGYFITALY